MIIEVLTTFPEMFPCVLQASILKRAQDSGLAQINVRNLRDYTTDKHRVTDDAPYGGGPGMVMKVEPIAAAFEALAQEHLPHKMLRVFVSPDGERWNQRLAEELAQHECICILCGHYEGVDERVREMYIDREFSIGDYVLTGGELPAMVIIDSIVRLLPGVLGNEESLAAESFSGTARLLDYPHYTRPEVFRDARVPEILLTGHHANIERWRREQALRRTLARRPDVLDEVGELLTKQDKDFLRTLMRETQE